MPSGFSPPVPRRCVLLEYPSGVSPTGTKSVRVSVCYNNLMFALLCETPDEDRPDQGLSEFDALFGSILCSQPDSVIGYERDGDAWDGMFVCDHGDDETVWNQFVQHRIGVIVPVKLFTRFIGYINGCSTAFWLFPDLSAADLPGVYLDYDPNIVSDNVFPTGATHMFSNTDGAYWMLFTPIESDIEQVEHRWHRTRRIDVATRHNCG